MTSFFSDLFNKILTSRYDEKFTRGEIDTMPRKCSDFHTRLDKSFTMVVKSHPDFSVLIVEMSPRRSVLVDLCHCSENDKRRSVGNEIFEHFWHGA